MSRATALPAEALLLAYLAACTVPVQSLGPGGTPLPSNPDGIPPGHLMNITLGVVMSSDNRTVTLRFVGATHYSPANPCSADYAGWARPQQDHLEVAVVETVVAGPPEAVCDLVGHERFVEVELTQPFLGSIAVDRANGGMLEVQRPFAP